MSSKIVTDMVDKVTSTSLLEADMIFAVCNSNCPARKMSATIQHSPPAEFQTQSQNHL